MVSLVGDRGDEQPVMKRMPTFIIGGAPRSGTTYLCHVLERHPQVYIAKPFNPEAKTFLGPERSPAEYAAHYETLFAPAGEALALGEKTSYYLENAEACDRIRRVLPGVRMVFIVREPVARAYSNYLWSRKNGLEPLEFEAALEQRNRPSPLPPGKEYARPFDYLERGDYAAFAERYHRALGRENVLFVLYEDLATRPAELFDRIQRFIGVDPRPLNDGGLGRINSAADAGRPIDPRTEQRLREQMAPQVRRFAELTGLDVSAWGYDQPGAAPRLPRARKPRVDIVTPVFNEEQTLPAYVETVRTLLLSRTDADYRVLFVDDGSRDKSWALIARICADDPRFRGLRLSRNFGSHVALSAGFEHTQADAVATLACDLQDPPETVLQFVEQWRQGARIVWGKRRARKDSFWRVATSRVFFTLMRKYAMPRHSRFATGGFFLIDRKVIDCFRQFREHNRITFAIVAYTGFDDRVVEYDRQERKAGVSGWTFSKMLKTMYDAFIGFSFLPVKLMTWLGSLVFLFSMLLGLYVVAEWLLTDVKPGWTSIVLLMSVFFGMQFFLMGIMGEYLYRIYSETTQRPLYFVSDKTFESEKG